MTHRAISITLAFAAVLAIAGFALASPTGRAEAHADPLEDLAAYAVGSERSSTGKSTRSWLNTEKEKAAQEKIALMQ